MQPPRGSPPQVRGKPVKTITFTRHFRITPAGAGKTENQSWLFRDIRDHPRRCGENYMSDSSTGEGIGSPPQVRGKRSCGRLTQHLTRITPAGAGKTQPHVRGFRRGQDHPRRCGENRYSCSRRRYRRGSPPQVRGKRPSCTTFAPLVRITPAGAGKTVFMCPENNSTKDHPRRCGENVDALTDCASKTGSPPQVRGKRVR